MYVNAMREGSTNIFLFHQKAALNEVSHFHTHSLTSSSGPQSNWIKRVRQDHHPNNVVTDLT
jgi:hypothetical protein